MLNASNSRLPLAFCSFVPWWPFHRHLFCFASWFLGRVRDQVTSHKNRLYHRNLSCWYNKCIFLYACQKFGLWLVAMKFIIQTGKNMPRACSGKRANVNTDNRQDLLEAGFDIPGATHYDITLTRTPGLNVNIRSPIH